MRYCNMTNGGPVFVYVKDGKIVRMTPIDLDDDDGASWTIEARGHEAHAAAQDHARAARPERQVDRLFARPAALSDEARRLRSERRAQSAEPRQVRLRAHLLGRGARPSSPTRSSGRSATYGPGCIAVSHGSHHTWGNIGYYLSALFRFANAIGMTRVHHNPDSWEGWYWGAVHHWGHTLRVGQSETYGTVEDCLQNCDMIVFWAADPETTSGSYGAQEGTVRRQWLKDPKLGIKVVHVDPVLQRVGAVPAGQVVRAEADHLARDGDGDRLRLDQGRPLRQGIREDPHRRLRQVEGLSRSATRTASRRRRSGRRRKPAFRPRTCARSRASGAGSASISRPAAGATATAAPAATRPASSGRA